MSHTHRDTQTQASQHYAASSEHSRLVISAYAPGRRFRAHAHSVPYSFISSTARAALALACVCMGVRFCATEC